jgi:hypothetical protein
LVITQRELSEMIGIARESTNKQLRVWEKRGWIRRTVSGRQSLSRHAGVRRATIGLSNTESAMPGSWHSCPPAITSDFRHRSSRSASRDGGDRRGC